MELTKYKPTFHLCDKIRQVSTFYKHNIASSGV